MSFGSNWSQINRQEEERREQMRRKEQELQKALQEAAGYHEMLRRRDELQAYQKKMHDSIWFGTPMT